MAKRKYYLKGGKICKYPDGGPIEHDDWTLDNPESEGWESGAGWYPGPNSIRNVKYKSPWNNPELLGTLGQLMEGSLRRPQNVDIFNPVKGFYGFQYQKGGYPKFQSGGNSEWVVPPSTITEKVDVPTFDFQEDNPYSTFSYPRVWVTEVPGVRRQPRPEINIEPIGSLSIGQLEKERPLPDLSNIENSFYSNGEYIQDWTNVPNLRVVSKKRKSDGQIIPVAIENSEGKRISWKKYRDKPLPKGFQYADVEKKQKGGFINTTGYTPGTESFNNPFNVIPSNKITMKNTPFPVLAIPDVGDPVVLKPGENKTFKNATQVTEIPLNPKKFQMGGSTGSYITNAAKDFQDSSTEVLREAGDPWEYQKVGGKWKTRKIGNKNWIEAKGLPLAAIKARYEPDSLTSSEEKLVKNHEEKQINTPGVWKKPTDWGTSGSQYSPQLLSNPYFVPPALQDPVIPSPNAPIVNPHAVAKPAAINQTYVPGSGRSQFYPGTTYPVNSPANVQAYVRPNTPIMDPNGRITIDLTNQTKVGDLPIIDYTVTDKYGNETAGAPDFDIINRMIPLYTTMLGAGLHNRILSGPTPVQQPWKTPKRFMPYNRTDYNPLFQYQEGGDVEMFNNQRESDFDLGSYLPFILEDPRNTLNAGKRNLIPIQAEKGEYITSPLGDIVKSAAKKRHKDMEDEPTDITAEENYIFSDSKGMTLKKNKGSASVDGIRFDEIQLGVAPMYYEEGKTTPTPKEYFLSDIEPNKNKYTFADAAGKVAKKFPLTERKDPFSRLAQVENKQSRIPYIEALKDLSERKKGNTGESNEYKMGGMINFNRLASMYGPIDPMMNQTKGQDKALQALNIIPKFPEGGEPGLNEGSSPYDEYEFDHRQRKQNKREQWNWWINQAQHHYRDYFQNVAYPGAQGQAFLNALGVVGQEPYRGQNEYLYGNQYFSRLGNQESQMMRDLDSDKAYYSSLIDRENSALRLAQDPSMLGSMRANAIRQSNEGISGLGRERRGHMSRFGDLRLNATDMFAGRQNQQKGYEQDFRNNQVSSLAGIGSSYIAQDAALRGQHLGAQTQLQLMEQPGNNWSDFTDSMAKILGTVGNFISAFVPGSGGGGGNTGQQVDGSYRYTGPNGPSSYGGNYPWEPGMYGTPTNSFSQPLRTPTWGSPGSGWRGGYYPE